MEPQGGPLAGAPSFMVVRACGESHAVNGPAPRVSQSAHGPPSPGFLLRCSGAPRLGFAAESSQPRRCRSGLGRECLAAPYHRRVVAAVAGPGPEGLPRQVDRPGAPCLHARQATCRASPGNPSRNLLHLAVSGMGPFPRHAARVSLRTTSPRGEESPCLPGRAISLLRDSSCSRLS